MRAMMKLARLGHVVEVWIGAIDENLYVTIVPKHGETDSLLAAERAHQLHPIEAESAIETRLVKYMQENGI